MLELLVALSVLAVALVGYAKTVGRAMVASRTSREASLANEAARTVIESMRAESLANVFRMYNDYAGDDIGGIVNPGADFDVAGLEARAGDADNLPGEVLFPVTMNAGVPELRENLVSTDFDMPKDLTGEGTVDAVNHAGNYTMLPLIVRVRWTVVGGPGEVEFQTILGGY